MLNNIDTEYLALLLAPLQKEEYTPREEYLSALKLLGIDIYMGDDVLNAKFLEYFEFMRKHGIVKLENINLDNWQPGIEILPLLTYISYPAFHADEKPELLHLWERRNK